MAADAHNSDERWYRNPTAEEQAAFAMAGRRSSGSTASESFLLHLCELSFLSLWSYAGVYRREKDGTCKELCDVLVVFGDDVVIFSDKHCAFGEAPLVKTAWTRWVKKAVEKSVKQLHGAEKYLAAPDPLLFLDNSCSNSFPIPLPKLEQRRTHLVAVARGAASASKEYFGSGTGSMIIDTTLAGDEHYEKPFRVGNFYGEKTFVHVFDEVGLEAVFSALTTAPDLLTYCENVSGFYPKGKLSQLVRKIQ